MKLTVLILTPALAMSAQTKLRDDKGLRVMVYLVNENVPGEDRMAESIAQGLTARMFADIGVEIQWQRQEPPGGLRPDHSIVVTVTTKVPASYRPHALAYAEPFGKGHITVFYDRLTGRSPKRVPILMAHVMAHEITHLLQGADYHSTSGIMKSKWNAEDYAEMDRNLLSFTPLDVRLIHQGMASWGGRIAGNSTNHFAPGASIEPRSAR